MPRLLETACSPQQLLVLATNAWRYAFVKGKHIRIRPCSPDVPVLPPGTINCTAEIEVLDVADKTWGEADSEGHVVVWDLFGDLL